MAAKNRARAAILISCHVVIFFISKKFNRLKKRAHKKNALTKLLTKCEKLAHKKSASFAPIRAIHHQKKRGKYQFKTKQYGNPNKKMTPQNPHY
jgi:hypothetical protein